MHSLYNTSTKRQIECINLTWYENNINYVHVIQAISHCWINLILYVLFNLFYSICSFPCCNWLIFKTLPIHSTVQLNYKFIFTHVYTHGTTRKLHCHPITCLHGPHFLVVCNMYISCGNTHGTKIHTHGTKIHMRGTKHMCTHACKLLMEYQALP